MATLPQNRRTDSIRVRLSPDMMGRFEAIAARYGMPPATLCSFAVAEFVQKQEAAVSLSRMAVMDASRKASEAFNFSDEQLEKILGPTLEATMRAMLPAQPPLDLGEPE